MAPKEQVSFLKVPDKALQLFQWFSVIDYQERWIHLPQFIFPQIQSHRKESHSHN